MSYEHDLAAFTATMREKLDANAYKSDYVDEEINDLFVRMVEEVGELAQALVFRQVHSDGGKGIGRECADVANFAMMIAARAGKP